MKSKMEEMKKFAVLGTYEGECADADITNANGLDITRDVWSTVFSSEAYEKAIQHGWYIGYLGHPEDPNCMDFKNACIIMREGRLLNNGKVYGKFDLVDTPVGRIVKAFQDAGVIFGISVRGAGDVINNSVDPDSFVFRGFDLVTFPAYPDAIPTFSAIAASTDVAKQSKYKAVCAAIQTNLNDIDQKEALAALKAQFAPQSDEYKAIEAKEQALAEDGEDNVDVEVLRQKLEGMTRLYLEEVEANTQLNAKINQLTSDLSAQSIQATKKLNAIRKIYQDQAEQANEYKQAAVEANEKNDKLTQLNLKYKQKVEASQKLLEDKDSVISSLRSELSETVSAVSEMKKKSSNLDARNKSLEADVTASQRIIEQYQDAYVSLYSSATGICPKNISVTASTSVDELKAIMRRSARAEEYESIYSSSNYADLDPADIVTEADDDLTIC